MLNNKWSPKTQKFKSTTIFFLPIFYLTESQLGSSHLSRDQDNSAATILIYSGHQDKGLRELENTFAVWTNTSPKHIQLAKTSPVDTPNCKHGWGSVVLPWACKERKPESLEYLWTVVVVPHKESSFECCFYYQQRDQNHHLYHINNKKESCHLWSS